MSPAAEILLSVRCVALLYFLYNGIMKKHYNYISKGQGGIHKFSDHLVRSLVRIKSLHL